MTTAAKASPQQDAALFRAIAFLNPDALTRALENGASPNARDAEKVSALSRAVENGFPEGVKQLVAAGSSIDYPSLLDEDNFRTPLDLALWTLRLDIADFLLSRGADPQITNHCDSTALMTLIDSGSLDSVRIQQNDQAMMILEKMLAVDGLVNKADRFGQTPLLYALNRGIDPTAVDILLARGANPDLETHDGAGVIHRPWLHHDLWKLRKLLDHGIDINSRDRSGTSVLSYATSEGGVMALLDLGADLNHLDNMGRNALAVIIDNLMLDRRIWQGAPMETAKALVAAGIDTEHADDAGASVESRLAEIATPESAALLALIAARKAKETMSNAIRAARVKP